MSNAFVPAAFLKDNLTTDEALNAMLGDQGITTRTTTQRQTGPKVSCAECGKPIQGRGVSALDKTYHGDCLKCSQCSLGIDIKWDGGFVVRGEDQVWCKKCDSWDKKLNNSSAPSRPVATSSSQRSAVKPPTSTSVSAADAREIRNRINEGKTVCTACGGVVQGDGFQTSLGVYHSSCFACTACGGNFTEGAVIKGGNPYHEKCVPQRNKAGGECTRCAKPLSGAVVSTQDGTKYHKACFCCASCRKQLTGSYAMKSGHPTCAACATSVTSSASKSVPGVRYKAAPTQPKQQQPPAQRPKFCTQCGTKSCTMDKFCGECGTSF